MVPALHHRIPLVDGTAVSRGSTSPAIATRPPPTHRSTRGPDQQVVNAETRNTVRSRVRRRLQLAFRPPFAVRRRKGSPQNITRDGHCNITLEIIHTFPSLGVESWSQFDEQENQHDRPSSYGNAPRLTNRTQQRGGEDPDHQSWPDQVTTKHEREYPQTIRVVTQQNAPPPRLSSAGTPETTGK